MILIKVSFQTERLLLGLAKELTFPQIIKNLPIQLHIIYLHNSIKNHLIKLVAKVLAWVGIKSFINHI